MAYQENTALSPEDIINKIVIFATANGWTAEQNTLSASNRIATLTRVETDYITLWNDASNVYIRGSIGYTAGQNGDGQPLNGFRSATMLLNTGGPYSRMYLFADDAPAPHVYAVVEISSGVYRKLAFGLVEKTGTYTGGTFYDATRWPHTTTGAPAWGVRNNGLFCVRIDNTNSTGGAVRVDIPADGVINAWASLYAQDSFDLRTGLSNADTTGDNSSGISNLVTTYYNRNEPTFSGTVALGAIVCDVQRPAGLWSRIGVFPNVRYLTMARFNPAQEITIGSDIWKIFPFTRKGVGTSGVAEPYSNNHALAFKRVT